MKKGEIREIARRLVEEAFFLYVLGGIGFFFAEAILPGIFSQRIDFFFLYAGFIVLALGVVVSGGLAYKESQDTKEDAENLWSVRKIILIIVLCILFLLPITKNIGPFLAPMLVLFSAVVLAFLAQDLLTVGKANREK